MWLALSTMRYIHYIPSGEHRALCGMPANPAWPWDMGTSFFERQRCPTCEMYASRLPLVRQSEARSFFFED
jgi:hypothetical protein